MLYLCWGLFSLQQKNLCLNGSALKVAPTAFNGLQTRLDPWLPSLPILCIQMERNQPVWQSFCFDAEWVHRLNTGHFGNVRSPKRTWGWGDRAKLFAKSHRYFLFLKQCALGQYPEEKIDTRMKYTHYLWDVAELYFHMGLTFKGIKSDCGSRHGFNISQRNLKRLLSARGLSPCKGYSKFVVPSSRVSPSCPFGVLYHHQQKRSQQASKGPQTRMQFTTLAKKC